MSSEAWHVTKITANRIFISRKKKQMEKGEIENESLKVRIFSCNKVKREQFHIELLTVRYISVIYWNPSTWQHEIYENCLPFQKNRKHIVIQSCHFILACSTGLFQINELTQTKKPLKRLELGKSRNCIDGIALIQAR